MVRRHETDARHGVERARDERGSALVLAIFVLVLLASMGTALLYLSQTEVQMSAASVREKQAFYLAEAGVERARTELWMLNDSESFDDDLANAAVDGTFDFDPDAIAPVYDASGTLTGFTGYGDDMPLLDMTAVGDGWTIAFLTNDPVDIALGSPLVDSNNRVMLTSVGVGPDRATETVQAIVELTEYLPSEPPATITLLGPSPAFASGKSKVKVYEGEDCGGTGGVPNLYMPVVGAVGSSNIGNAESGMETNPTYTSGPYADADTFADLGNLSEPLVSSIIDPAWNDCDYLRDMVEGMCEVADVTCLDGGSCAIPATAYPFVCVKDDYTVGPGPHAGLLVVTGELTLNGNADWAGLILVVGEGQYQLNGGGTGLVSGGVVVADIAGPDGIYGTGDDCSGGDGGFGQVLYDENGGGNSGTQYCTTDLDPNNPARPYEVVEFRQR